MPPLAKQLQASLLWVPSSCKLNEVKWTKELSTRGPFSLGHRRERWPCVRSLPATFLLRAPSGLEPWIVPTKSRHEVKRVISIWSASIISIISIIIHSNSYRMLSDYHQQDDEEARVLRSNVLYRLYPLTTLCKVVPNGNCFSVVAATCELCRRTQLDSTEGTRRGTICCQGSGGNRAIQSMSAKFDENSKNKSVWCRSLLDLLVWFHQTSLEEIGNQELSWAKSNINDKDTRCCSANVLR